MPQRTRTLQQSESIDLAASLHLSGPTQWGIGTYPPGATFGPRRMTDYEFVWMIEGDAEYQWADQTVAAPAGSIVLCRPGETDFFQWDQHRRTRHGYFHFQVENIPADWPGHATWPLVRMGIDGDVLRPLFRHLLTWGQQGDPHLRILTMQHMLTAFVRGQHASSDIPRDTLPPPVEKAMAYLHATLDKDPASPIPLEDLASVANVTREHLCRLFLASTDHSPVETVRLARLDRSAVLLARSNYSIKEISEICGFANPFHLSRRFTHAFGQSPRDLRKKIRAGQTPPTSLLLRRQ